MTMVTSDEMYGRTQTHSHTQMSNIDYSRLFGGEKRMKGTPATTKEQKCFHLQIRHPIN